MNNSNAANLKKSDAKIKKTLSAVLAFLLVLAFCFSAVGCRQEEGGKDPETLTELIERVQYGVVEIQTEARLGGGKTYGSGFIVSDKLPKPANGSDEGCVIITNYHVIKGDNIVRVRFFGSEEYTEATVRGYNEDFDTAVLAVNYLPLKRHVFALGDAPVLGGEVFALGYTSHRLSVYSGTVSVKDRWVEVKNEDKWSYVFETGFAAAYGTSGGPCIDKNGVVRGLNRLNRTVIDTKDEFLAGVSYKVPATVVAALFARITESEFEVADPALGFFVFDGGITVTLFGGVFDVCLSAGGALKISNSAAAGYPSGAVVSTVNGKDADFCTLVAELILTGRETQITFLAKK